MHNSVLICVYIYTHVYIYVGVMYLLGTKGYRQGYNNPYDLNLVSVHSSPLAGDNPNSSNSPNIPLSFPAKHWIGRQVLFIK